MKVPIRAYAVDAVINDQRVLVLQIEIDDPVEGTLRYTLPGRYLRLVRDILIDHIDQFPELSGQERRSNVERTTFNLQASEKPELN